MSTNPSSIKAKTKSVSSKKSSKKQFTLSSPQRKKYQEKALKLYALLEQRHPNAEIELNFENNFQLLVAVLLSAQATDISVNKVTDSLFLSVKGPEDILKLSHDQLENHIKSIGLWKAKARHVRQLSEQLIEKFDSNVPQTLEELESLPGVGRKTASVVMSIAFDTPIIAVDTHVFRVSKRLGLSPEPYSIPQVAEFLNNNTPTAYLASAHHLLIFHGRYVCKARQPLCNECTLAQYCPYNKNL